MSDQGEIQLLQVRHPLIEQAVPNDIHFGKDLHRDCDYRTEYGWEDHHAKTLGLAQLMAQSGLPILADAGSKVAVFTQIFSDIGDEQSIEQSLSTFSSHMTNIVSIFGAGR